MGAMPRKPATAPVTVRVTVELPGRTLTEETTLDLPADQTWDGPLSCADLIKETTDKVRDVFLLTLPSEWPEMMGTKGVAARLVTKIAELVDKIAD